MSVSLAIFGPHGRPLPTLYRAAVREYLVGHLTLICIPDQISTLHTIWSLLVKENKDIAKLSKGPQFSLTFQKWLVEGALNGPVFTSSSAIVVLPRLAITQFAQYFQFIESRDLTHIAFISGLSKAGGIQGFYGGFPAAAALASAGNDEELKQAICTAIRLAFGIGLCAELGDDSDIPGVTTAVVRGLNWRGLRSQNTPWKTARYRILDPSARETRDPNSSSHSFEEADEFALSLLLNRMPGKQLKIGELVSNSPRAERVASICPTARVRAGNHRVPTFIVHAHSDEVASMNSASGLYEDMRRHGVHSELLTVKRGHQGYDIRLRPGMSAWDEQVPLGYPISV